jgi:hypothetical protein
MPPALCSRSSTAILPDIVPRELRLRRPVPPGLPQDDDVALDHSSSFPAAIAATLALQ